MNWTYSDPAGSERVRMWAMQTRVVRRPQLARFIRFAALTLLPFAGAAAAQSTQTAAPSPPPPPSGCTTAEHRQFDFWVGRWDVYRTGTNQQIGRSLIENLYNGCVIRENWMPLRGGGGSSLNSWLPRERRWRQTWADGGNSYAVFEGTYQNDEMVITGVWAGPTGPAGTPLVRMHYSRVEGGGLRQWGEQSTDNGATWAVSFDFTYRPAAES